MQIDKLTADEKRAFAAQLNAKLSQWQTDCAADAERSERMKAEHEAWQRRFDADKLLRDLYGTSYGHEELHAAIEQALVDLPTAPLDDAELARLKRRHLALRLVEKIAALKGPLSAATEMALFQMLEKAMAPKINIQQGKQND